MEGCPSQTSSTRSCVIKLPIRYNVRLHVTRLRLITNKPTSIAGICRHACRSNQIDCSKHGEEGFDTAETSDTDQAIFSIETHISNAHRLATPTSYHRPLHSVHHPPRSDHHPRFGIPLHRLLGPPLTAQRQPQTPLILLLPLVLMW